MTNSIKILNEHQKLCCFSLDYLKSEEVVAQNKVLQLVFDRDISSPNIEPTILDQLEK